MIDRNSDGEDVEVVGDDQTEISWYEKIMALKPLGHEIFDENVSKMIESNPDKMLQLVFTADAPDENYEYEESLYGEAGKHAKNINMLHLACQEGLLNTAKFIVKRDPDQLNFKSASGWTPLMTACEAGSTNVIEMIYEETA